MNRILRCFRLLAVFLCFLQGLKAQHANNWYFAKRAGITFNTNPPSALADGVMDTNEGCSAISDANGQLLFYTDGSTVWNKLHQVMVNGTGLKGHFSSTNSAIIIPRPGSSTLYYIFTAGEISTNNEGYFYSEVDISLDGGLGAVTGTKNILLYAPSTEKLTAVRHSNGVDVWIITRVFESPTWKAFRIDCNGVNTNPVTSFSDHPSSSLWRDANAGCLKASPDGTKIAAANPLNNIWEILQFDASTGILSNNLFFPSSQAPYGVEFSPNSKLLYISNAFSETTLGGNINQYNLVNYDSVSIASSKVSLGNTDGFGGALQRGPDNKIYCSVGFLPYLGAINNPDLPGIACGFNGHQVDLANGSTAYFGLPSFFPPVAVNGIADFNYIIEADCATVDFSGSSTIPGNLNWQWDFGDGATGTGQNVSHTYLAGGPATDTVKLTVSSVGGCGTVVVKKQVIVNPGSPVANFGFDTVCGNQAIHFTDSSLASGSSIQSWSWDFGDGSSSIEQNPTHIFNASGIYPVTLTITSAGSCNRTASVQKNVVVELKPLAAFTSTGACINQPLSFTDNSSAASGTIGSWHWDFGDGTSSLQQHPQKIYAVPGTYKVKLVVGTSSGCTSDTLEKSITIAGLPIAGITPSVGCVREPISFRDASVSAGDAITRWYWNLGDGSTSVEQNPTNIYANPGAYAIKHVVESAGGCISDTATVTVRVESIPLAGIAAINGCQGLNLQFRDSSSIDFGNITSWNWNFGDGSVATVQNPAHTYAVPGTYNVKLVVQSTNGCLSDTLSKTVTVGAIPEVLFSNTAACIGQPIQFTNQTVLADGTITGYSWDFGDGSNAAVENPIHTYNREGDFTVTLTAITGNGCTATTTKTLHIAPVRAFAGNDTTVAIGQPLQLQASGGLDYKWTPADFLSADNISNPIATLDRDQTYRVRVITEEGCVGEDEIRIQVVKGPAIYVPGGFAPDGKNRIFRPVLAGIDELYYFSVYNRWGQLVFTTREPGKGWDGRFNGVAQPSAVFVWMLKARDYLGEVITRNGTVVLIR